MPRAALRLRAVFPLFSVAPLSGGGAPFRQWPPPYVSAEELHAWARGGSGDAEAGCLGRHPLRPRGVFLSVVVGSGSTTGPPAAAFEPPFRAGLGVLPAGLVRGRGRSQRQQQRLPGPPRERPAGARFLLRKQKILCSKCSYIKFYFWYQFIFSTGYSLSSS